MASPKSKKKIKGFKEFDASKYIETEPTLEEAVGKNTAVITFGRMNPMTVGHEKLVSRVASEALKRKGEPMVFLSHSSGAKSKTGKGSENKDPIVYDDKIKFAIKAFGPIVKKSPLKTLFDIMRSLNGKFKNVVMIAGSDRVDEYTSTLQKYNGKEYNFDSIKVISAGARDPDGKGVSGMSGTKMREYAKSNDVRKFSKGLPKNLQSNADEVMAAVRKGLNMSEEVELDEALNRMQRRKRALAMKKARFKIKRGREKAAKRTASQEVLKKRAKKAAINIFKQKFAKNRRYAELSSGEKEVVDKRIEKISKKRIEAIARKLLPKVKQKERDRRSSAMSGGSSKNESVNEASLVDTKVRQRPHMLIDKNNKTKIDGRFKMFKKKAVTESVEDLSEELTDLIEATEQFNEGEKKGLWANIHAKRKRIKAGSGEKMRKPGSKGAPTDADFKAASESVELDEAKWKVSIPGVPRVYVDAQSASDVKRDMRKLVKPEHLDDIEIERVQPSEIKKDFRDRAAAKVNEEHGAGDWGTDELTNNFKAATPGENGKVTNVKKPSENKALKEGMGKKLAAQAALRIAAHYAKKTINNRLKNKDQQSQPEQ